MERKKRKQNKNSSRHFLCKYITSAPRHRPPAPPFAAPPPRPPSYPPGLVSFKKFFEIKLPPFCRRE